MKRVALFLVVLASSLYSDSMEHITKQLTGEDVKISASGQEIKKPDTSGIYNYSEVVYEHVKLRQSRAQAPQEGGQMALSEDIRAKKAKEIAGRIALAAKERSQAAEQASLPSWPKFAEGYCYIKNDVEVEKIATYAYMSCDFTTPVGRGELVASLVPDFYAMALVAKPLYLNIMDNNRKKQRIPIVSGAILTQNRLSINIANVVNDRKIAKIVAAGTYSTLNAVTQQAQLYLNDSRAARVKQAATTNSNAVGSSTVVTTNTEKPVAQDYYLAATFQVVSELAKVIGENIVASLPYTFKVNKDSILYADIELAQTQAIRGFDPQVTNMIKKQPTFDITKGKEADSEITAVPIRTLQK